MVVHRCMYSPTNTRISTQNFSSLKNFLKAGCTKIQSLLFHCVLHKVVETCFSAWNCILNEWWTHICARTYARAHTTNDSVMWQNENNIHILNHPFIHWPLKSSLQYQKQTTLTVTKETRSPFKLPFWHHSETKLYYNNGNCETMEKQ
jgi:hypothetical protein